MRKLQDLKLQLYGVFELRYKEISEFISSKKKHLDSVFGTLLDLFLKNPRYLSKRRQQLQFAVKTIGKFIQ